MSFRYVSAIVLAIFAAKALAESHTVTFVNNCGKGQPTLVQAGKILSTGGPYTSNGPLTSAIAYLQDGSCLLNGEHCTLVELNLQDGGAGANSADISLIDPHTFNVAAAVDFTGSAASCGGAACGEGSCNSAFHKSDDTCVQVGCTANEAGLKITFCGVKTGFTASGHPTAPC